MASAINLVSSKDKTEPGLSPGSGLENCRSIYQSEVGHQSRMQDKTINRPSTILSRPPELVKRFPTPDDRILLNSACTIKLAKFRSVLRLPCLPYRPITETFGKQPANPIIPLFVVRYFPPTFGNDSPSPLSRPSTKKKTGLFFPAQSQLLAASLDFMHSLHHKH